VGPAFCVLVRTTLTLTPTDQATMLATTTTTRAPAAVMRQHGKAFDMLSWHFRHHTTQQNGGKMAEM